MKQSPSRFLHVFSLALALGLFVYFNQSGPETVHNSSPATKRLPAMIPKGRKLPPVPSPAPPMPGRAPASIVDFRKLIEPHPEVKLAGSMVLTKNIGAIPLRDWSPGMKPLLTRSVAYGFYEKSPNDKTIAVAYNPLTNQFHVVSEILQVRGASEGLRKEFRNRGIEEYTYFPRLELLFLKSPGGDVVSLYQKLRDEGHNVRLEIFKDRPTSR